MGKKGLRRCVMGGRVSTVSPLVGVGTVVGEGCAGNGFELKLGLGLELG
jgi:hypothetical protein